MKPMKRHHRWWRYGVVSGLCFAFQYALLVMAVKAGLRPEWMDNALAFAVSAQLNYILSRTFTWGDRRDSTRVNAWRGLSAYNLTALASLGLNTVGFWLVYQLEPVLIVAQLAGAVVGLAFTYTVCNQAIFRVRALASDPTRNLQIVEEGL